MPVGPKLCLFSQLWTSRQISEQPVFILLQLVAAFSLISSIESSVEENWWLVTCWWKAEAVTARNKMMCLGATWLVTLVISAVSHPLECVTSINLIDLLFSYSDNSYMIMWVELWVTLSHSVFIRHETCKSFNTITIFGRLFTIFGWLFTIFGWLFIIFGWLLTLICLQLSSVRP